MLTQEQGKLALKPRPTF